MQYLEPMTCVSAIRLIFKQIIDYLIETHIINFNPADLYHC